VQAWDSSASICGGDAALRSTRTLDAVSRTLWPALIFVALASMLWSQVAYYFSIRRLIESLKSRHWVTWDSLGCPTPLMQSFWPQQNFYLTLITKKLSFRRWLSKEGYLDLHDPEITALTIKCRRLDRVALACLLVAVACAVALGLQSN